MNEIGILHEQILINVQQYVVHENRDESINDANWVCSYLLRDVVGIRRINRQSLDEFDVVHAANECVLAFSDAAAEPEHANECVNSRDKEEEFAKFH